MIVKTTTVLFSIDISAALRSTLFLAVFRGYFSLGSFFQKMCCKFQSLVVWVLTIMQPTYISLATLPFWVKLCSLAPKLYVLSFSLSQTS